MIYLVRKIFEIEKRQRQRDMHVREEKAKAIIFEKLLLRPNERRLKLSKRGDKIPRKK